MVGPDPFTELVEDCAVVALVKQLAVERLVGEDPDWHANLDEGRLRVGRRRFRIDVVGTEAYGQPQLRLGVGEPVVRR